MVLDPPTQEAPLMIRTNPSPIPARAPLALTLAAALLCSFSLAARAADTGPAKDHQSDKDAAVPAHQEHPVDANPPAPKGTRVDLAVGGASAIAYAAKPAGEPRGAVLVIHEYWGLNDWVKHEADELAGLGYLALAVDLYKGQVATTPDDAKKLMAGLDNDWAAKVEHAGILWLKANAPKHDLATIGWCMGGGQSLQASLNDPADIAATIIYYGMPVTDPAVLAKLKAGAVLGIFAKKDGWITPDKVAAFDKALTDAGVPHAFTSYDADHAFANPTGGRHNPDAAKDAWKRTRAFLASHLN
jgi:carboxymethylenebutenolidase